jgi:hypothetical protein
MPNTKTVSVKSSKAHRRKKHWVKGHFVGTSKPFRIRSHKRNTRSTKTKIKSKGTRKSRRNKP